MGELQPEYPPKVRYLFVPCPVWVDGSLRSKQGKGKGNDDVGQTASLLFLSLILFSWHVLLVGEFIFPTESKQ